MSSWTSHATALVAIMLLDSMWLALTGRLEPYMENAETMFFAILSRVLVYAWIMYTVIPAIQCSKDYSLPNIISTGAIKGFTAFGMWNFATVDSFQDAWMPIVDTFWGMFLTVTVSVLTLEVDGRVKQAAKPV
jgi:uncharacterized membrane protein